MRYWYLDSADFITLMLVDKGYYDYDFSEPKHKKRINPSEVTILSDAEVAAELSRAIIPGTNKLVHEQKPLSPEQLQAEVIAEEKQKQEVFSRK